jgi:THAP4-like, heme-binding beta-barrel domain
MADDGRPENSAAAEDTAAEDTAAEETAADTAPESLAGTGGALGDSSAVEITALPPEHPAIAPLSFLLGRWKGTGKGDYPTIESFDFLQEVTFSHIGKPYLIYTSRSWRLATAENGELQRDEQGELVRLEPLSVEAGFWRPQPEGKVEVLLSHPTGITEIYAGEFRSLTSIEMVTDVVARTESAKPYTAGKRLYGLVPSQTREGEKDLAYAFDMAAMGQPLQPHLWAVLQWDWIE